jgi:cyclophilin family peptidyl-prolyl cis-trans isomerase
MQFANGAANTHPTLDTGSALAQNSVLAWWTNAARGSPCMYRAVTLWFVLSVAAPFWALAADDDSERFGKLFDRKVKIVARFQALQKSFQQSKVAEDRQRLAEEFESLRTEFQSRVYPELCELAPKVYAADRQNFDAGETALEVSYQNNRFDESARIADQLLADGRKTSLIRNLAGASHFAIHDFATAEKILSAAEKENELIPQLGGQYLETTADYIKLWEQEQAIRAKGAAATEDEQLPRVKLNTSRGEIVLELFENEAPNTVASFIRLVESKTYDGVKFHRVIPAFMAQGGDPLSKDNDPRNDGTGGPGYTIKCECYRPDARRHFRGSLSMAHAGKDTGGSQFFLTHLPTAHLNPNPTEQTGHTVFGRVVTDMDVVASLQVGDVIESATVLRKRKHAYEPQIQRERGE